MVEPTATERDLIEKLAESFVSRLRAGERPSIDEFAQQYPELADELRELLPALMMLEQHASESDGDEFRHAARGGAALPVEIGDYAIIREIGRGGMGIVYEAMQKSLGRHVALKVLATHALVNPSHLERFHLEARAAARLHHTHIVPVFGVGEHNGLHFYAMQFIQGQSLDLVIEALRQLRGKAMADRTTQVRNTYTVVAAKSLLMGKLPDEAADIPDLRGADDQRSVAANVPVSAPGHAELSATYTGHEFHRSVARVGQQVAEALAYAHCESILHRDIKPSNLLLDARGNTWITDFGLAKTEGTDGLTQTGDFVGTLRYMAPERFEGWSDRRSDIYGLGATLYELLTLETLYPGSSRARLMDQILHEPPKSPKKLDATIPQDLETIILKAMAKEPTERYHSAEEMAEDLRRFLADRPILARRATPLEQFLSWRRRNPMVAALATAVAALLVATIATLAVSNTRVRHESAARAVALDEKNEALSTAHGAINQMLTHTASEAFEDAPRLHPVRVALLEDALKYYEVLASKTGADPQLRYEMALVLQKKADLERELDLYDDAIRSLKRCIEWSEPLIAIDPTPPQRLETLAEVQRDLGLTFSLMSNPPADNARRVEAQYRKVYALYEKLQRDWPDRPQPVAQCLRYLGEFARQRGDRAEALRLWRSAVEHGEVYVAKYPDDVNEMHELSWACCGLFDLLSETSPGCSSECESILQRGLAPVETQLAKEPEAIQAVDVATALRFRQALCLCRRDRIADAIDMFDQVTGDMQSLCEAFPWNANYWTNLRWFHEDMTANLRFAGHAEEANTELREYSGWLQTVSAKLPDEPGPQAKLLQNKHDLIETLRSAGLEQDAKALEASIEQR
jgi:serine/threonine protein kinase